VGDGKKTFNKTLPKLVLPTVKDMKKPVRGAGTREREGGGGRERESTRAKGGREGASGAGPPPSRSQPPPLCPLLALAALTHARSSLAQFTDDILHLAKRIEDKSTREKDSVRVREEKGGALALPLPPPPRDHLSSLISLSLSTLLPTNRTTTNGPRPS